MTVAVETQGSRVYVGRCHEYDETGILLLDADMHEEGKDGISNADWLKAAVSYGVWKKLDRVLIPRAEILSVRKLGELTL